MRHAFSLIELMVVVVIAGAIYGIAVNGIRDVSQVQRSSVSLEQIDNYMKPFHKQNHLALICTDRCRECTLYADGRMLQDVAPFVDTTAEYYRFDYFTGADAFDWPPFYPEHGQEKEVCFRYDLFPDGSKTEMMVLYKERLIDFSGYFGKTVSYPSLQAAVDAKRAMYDEVRL